VTTKSRFPTRIFFKSNLVVVVSGSSALHERAASAAQAATGAQTVAATIASAATICAELRPYAIVVPREVYEFGGAEFEALARDVEAGLLAVPEGIQVGLLTALLSEEGARLG